MLDRIVASWLGSATALGALAVAALAAPPAAPLALAAGAYLAWRRRQWLSSYPLKAPRQSGVLDRHQPHPATGKPTAAQGMLFLGNEIGTNKEVWLTNSDARQHFLTLGTTGSGRTEALLGMATNALSWGSGFTIIDGKGDVSLFAKVHALCRLFGREDSLLCLNFMAGAYGLPSGMCISHRMNPFRRGAPDMLTQLVVSLMDDMGGDGAMWKGRATAMLTGVMRAVCWLRDNDDLTLTPGVLRDHLALTAILRLAEDERLPAHVAKGLRAYLSSLPGFQMERGVKQAQTTMDQHGYLEMQFTKILGSIADVYSHIFAEDGVDVDITEVMLNRRILVVLLPALEKSGDEIANLGKIITATFKGALGATLGSRIEGSWEEVIENRPTNAAAPYVVLADEAGYYLVEGLALMCAQARSLGLSMVVGSQDIPALKRLNEREARSIIANTNTKLFMRAETTEGFEAMTFNGHGGRIDPVGLKGQTEGEAHVVFQDRLVRTRLFYADPFQALERRKLRIRMPQLVSLDWNAEDAAAGAAGAAKDAAVPGDAP